MTPRSNSDSEVLRAISVVERDVAVAKRDHAYLSGAVTELSNEIKAFRADIESYKTDKGFVIGISTAVSAIIGLAFAALGVFWAKK